MNLLLENLASHSNRKARFRTVITYKTSQQVMQFEGIIEGEIISEKKGEYGFGYDPIFVPNGTSKTFAQMRMSEKNKYSHRSRAFEKLRAFLESK
jgi:XTP/dITP diphosphohydrolase